MVEFNIQKVDNENRFNECAGGISYEVAPYAKEMHEYYEWCEWAMGFVVVGHTFPATRFV